MATKVALEKAYKAGHALPDVKFADDAPERVRVIGVHHNPFDLRVEDQVDEAKAWLKGLKDRLEKPVADPAAVLSEVEDALEAI